jgi:hypothetical protein
MIAVAILTTFHTVFFFGIWILGIIDAFYSVGRADGWVNREAG